MKTTKMVIMSALILSNVLLAGTTVSAADGGEYKSGGAVGFIPNNDETPTPPVDPEDPDPEKPVGPIDPTNPEGPNPGTSGPLSLDYASSLHFGENKISNKNEIYYANAQEFESGHIAGQYRGNYVQVSDNRGSVAGWTLTVKQTGQFHSEKATNYKTLKGSVIKFESAVADSKSIGEVAAPDVTSFELDPEGASSLVMSAKTGAGVGLWVDYFGEAEEMTIDGKAIQKNKAVSLSVPGATPKEATEYKTSLVWTLSDVPGK